MRSYIAILLLPLLLVAVAPQAAQAEIIDVQPRTLRYSYWKEHIAPCRQCTLIGSLRLVNLPQADSTAQALRGLKESWLNNIPLCLSRRNRPIVPWG